MSQETERPSQHLAAAVVTIGVTGHRTLAAPKKLTAQFAAVLDLIQVSAANALADRDNPLHGQDLQLRIVSSLAEGADRLVAQVGLDRGASLQCILPLPRADYATDFEAPAAKRGFTELLKRADRVFELDGAGDRPDAYLAAGRMLLRQSDILIAVWDGEPARGTGGTAEIVAEALARRAPVVWLKPDGAPAVILAGTMARRVEHNIAVLDEVVRRLVSPPEDQTGEAPATSFRSFVDDSFSGWAVPANLFDGITRWLIKKKPAFVQSSPAKSLETSLGYWADPYKDHADIRGVCAPCLDEPTAAPFARADMLANRYAGLYRSTYLANFTLSALAVAVALFGSLAHALFAPIAKPLWEFLARRPLHGVAVAASDALGQIPWASLGEFFCIVAVITLTQQANKRHYHERWIEYRHLAERIRPLRYLFALGLTLPPDNTSHYLDKERGKGGWSHWAAHRVERQLGVPDVVVTPAYLLAVRRFASHAILEEQIEYHRTNAGKLADIEGRLHRNGERLFVLTLVGCLLEIPAHFWVDNWPSEISKAAQAFLTLITGLLPAVGAAVLGIRNVGEFKRLEARSRSMREGLLRMRKVFDEDEPIHLSLASLSEELEALADQMMLETADWRTLLSARRIELPS